MTNINKRYLPVEEIPPALSLKQIGYHFGGGYQQGADYLAIADTSLSVAGGEFVSVVGPTGCGKSTLLNLAAGLLMPTAGEVQVFGQRLSGLNTRAGYMFQNEVLLPWRTASENILLGLQYRGVDKQNQRQQVRYWLARVGLTAFADCYPHQLSGGMRKRVALAQMLILDPDIILMDEPFSSLDIQTRYLMENELLALWEAKKKAVLFITHDLDEAIALSDRVIVLSAGPASHPVGEFSINLPRPRDVNEIRHQPQFIALHAAIWDVLRNEVLTGYQQQQQRG